jgi:hypothetical protein
VTGKDTQTAVTISKSVKVHVVGKGTIKVYKDLKAPDGKSKPLAEDKHEFKITLQQSTTSGWKDVETKTIAAGGSQVFDVQTGLEYRVVEVEDRDYVQMENTGPVLLEKNAETKEIRLTGKQKFAIIKVYKDIADTDVAGSAAADADAAETAAADNADAHCFWVKLNGGSPTMYQPFIKGFPTFFLVWPGSYTVAEFPEAGYKPGDYKVGPAVRSNGIYIINKGLFDEIFTDGSRIVFSSTRDGNYEIYAMSADGSGQTRITNNTADEDAPSFSPDGSMIAFSSTRDGNSEIYIMKADGSGQTRLTNNSVPDRYSSFSPDGKKIVFMSDRDGNWEIYAMNSDGSAQTRLTNNSVQDYAPSFSSDGKRIIFTSWRNGSDEICIMNADGSGQTNLTNNPAAEMQSSFSPDGSKISFASDRDGNWEIYVMNADGSGQKNLTNNPADDVSSSFSH